MGRLSCFEVDVESDFVFIDVKADHSAVRQETGSFSHCENSHPAQAVENCALVPGLVAAEEQDVATLDFLQLTYQADVQFPCSNGLSLDGALEFNPARFVEEDTEPEGSIASGQDAFRPTDKLREVEKKRSLDLVLL
jgi:hypothetical protein